MVIEKRWKTWVFFYIPLAVFMVGTLFPFYWMLITAVRPDAELYRSWRAATNTPFWTLQPTLEHFRDLMAKTTFPRWLWNTFFIAVASDRKTWVFFYIPLAVFMVGTLFPFYWMLITAVRPDAELYRSWRAATNTPFWTLQPTLEHFRDLMAKTTFPRWLWNTFFIAVA